MKNKFMIGLAGLAALATLGCYRVPASLSASSTPLDSRNYQVIGPASATTRQTHILGLVPLRSRPQALADTVEAARRQAGADALIEVTVETTLRHYVLFTTYTTEVNAKAIRFLPR